MQNNTQLASNVLPPFVKTNLVSHTLVVSYVDEHRHRHNAGLVLLDVELAVDGVGEPADVLGAQGQARGPPQEGGEAHHGGERDAEDDPRGQLDRHRAGGRGGHLLVAG